MAHANPSIIGQDLRSFKDLIGKAFGEEMVRVAQEGKVTGVSYMWPRPGSDTPVAKESSVIRAADQICGVGYYK